MEREPGLSTTNSLRKQFPGVPVNRDIRNIDAKSFARQKAKQEAIKSDKAVIGIVWVNDDEVVLVHRSENHIGWAMAGGAVEDESFEAAFDREIGEELGVKLDSERTRLLQIDDRRFVSPAGEELSMVLAVFEGHIAAGEVVSQTAEATSEGLQVGVFPITGLPEAESMIFGDLQKLQSAINARTMANSEF